MSHNRRAWCGVLPPWHRGRLFGGHGIGFGLAGGFGHVDGFLQVDIRLRGLLAFLGFTAYAVGYQAIQAGDFIALSGVPRRPWRVRMW